MEKSDFISTRNEGKNIIKGNKYRVIILYKTFLLNNKNHSPIYKLSEKFKEDYVRPRRKGNSKMKKWNCGCTNVRGAVELKAQCLKCRQLFTRAEPALVNKEDGFEV